MKTLLLRLWYDPKTARKFIAALIGAVLILVSNGVLPPETSDWVEVVVPFLVAGGVYATRNKPDSKLINQVRNIE